MTAAVPAASSAQILMAPQVTSSPTVLRILLGAYLRRLREARRVSLEDAGSVIRASHSKMSRLETGRVSFKDRDITDLLTFYGITDENEREGLRAVAIRASAPAWWHNYADVLPAWFDAYAGLEEAASEIRGYDVQFVPGLLQTADYARAVIMLSYSHPKEISRRVQLRMARQSALDRPDPPSLRLVLDESLLMRPMGGPAVTRAQLRHLIEMSQRPNISLQVIPLNAGGHAAAGGSFRLLRFANIDVPDVVYMEQISSAQYHDKPDIVHGYLTVTERLFTEALSPARSVRHLRELLREA